MTWWKVDDGWSDHPKVVMAGNEAAGVWARAANWSAAHNTDGFVPTAIWAMYAPTNWRKVTARLLEAKAGREHGLIEPAEGGFRIHDFLDDNPSREKVLAERAKRGELRGSDITAAVKRRDGNRCRYCADEVNWRDRRGERGGTYDHVEPGLAGGVDNLVVACRSCNARKAGRTPQQAGMVLLPAPAPGSGPGAKPRSEPRSGGPGGPRSDDIHAGRVGSGSSGSGQVGSGPAPVPLRPVGDDPGGAA